MSPVAAPQEKGYVRPTLLGCAAATLVAVVGFGSQVPPTRVEAAAQPAAPAARSATTPGSPTTRTRERKAVARPTESEPTIPETIETVFGPDAEVALRVAECESRLDPGAVGPYGSLGVFQIHPGSHTWRVDAVDGSELTDVETNIRVAYHLFTQQGWSPWTCARMLGLAA